MPQDRGFPERLTRARTAAGFSRRALGRLADVSEAYISRLEHGQRTASPVVRRALAHALGVDSEWLAFGREIQRKDVDRNTDVTQERLPAAIEQLLQRERIAPEVGRLPRRFVQRYLQRVDSVRADATNQWRVTVQDVAQRIERELGDFRARLMAEWRAERPRRSSKTTDGLEEA